MKTNIKYEYWNSVSYTRESGVFKTNAGLLFCDYQQLRWESGSITLNSVSVKQGFVAMLIMQYPHVYQFC